MDDFEAFHKSHKLPTIFTCENTKERQEKDIALKAVFHRLFHEGVESDLSAARTFFQPGQGVPLDDTTRAYLQKIGLWAGFDAGKLGNPHFDHHVDWIVDIAATPDQQVGQGVLSEFFDACADNMLANPKGQKLLSAIKNGGYKKWDDRFVIIGLLDAVAVVVSVGSAIIISNRITEYAAYTATGIFLANYASLKLYVAAESVRFSRNFKKMIKGTTPFIANEWASQAEKLTDAVISFEDPDAHLYDNRLNGELRKRTGLISLFRRTKRVTSRLKRAFDRWQPKKIENMTQHDVAIMTRFVETRRNPALTGVRKPKNYGGFIMSVQYPDLPGISLRFIARPGSPVGP